MCCSKKRERRALAATLLADAASKAAATGTVHQTHDLNTWAGRCKAKKELRALAATLLIQEYNAATSSATPAGALSARQQMRSGEHGTPSLVPAGAAPVMIGGDSPPPYWSEKDMGFDEEDSYVTVGNYAEKDIRRSTGEDAGQPAEPAGPAEGSSAVNAPTAGQIGFWGFAGLFLAFWAAKRERKRERRRMLWRRLCHGI